MDPTNFVPITRTPWGGTAIGNIKRKYLQNQNKEIPSLIGESWEVSTDAQFPSRILDENGNLSVYLKELIERHPETVVGKEVASRYGAHSPLLLKWLHAKDVLSVQVHPRNDNERLSQKECGKPESWLVLKVDPSAFLYLGFKEGLTEEAIRNHLRNDEPEKCLHKYFPRELDYISVPPGCVHAVGPGVLVAEPQLVLPGRSGTTWRLSDWRRLYDDEGNVTAIGHPRELHVNDGLRAIDWSLPSGKALEELLVRNMKNATRFEGDSYNPFCVEVFSEAGAHSYIPFVKEEYSILTVWSGKATVLSADGERVTLVGGESGFLGARATQPKLLLEDFEGEAPRCAIFSLDPNRV